MDYENSSFTPPPRAPGKNQESSTGMKNDKKALKGYIWRRQWERLACQLIFLCRFFAQAHETSIVSTLSSIRLRNVFIAADDALDTAVDLILGSNDRRFSAKERSEVDNKFKTALHLLSDFAKEFPPKDPTSDPNVDRNVNPMTILRALTDNLQANQKENREFSPGGSRRVKFHLLKSLSNDPDPIIVELFLKSHPSCSEILWYLRCFKDKKERFTFMENPHFYANLPTLLKAHGDSLNIDPTEDYQPEQANTFYVLTDRQQPVHIVIGNKILHSFGNLWRYENTIIFKDNRGRLMGEGIVKASLGGTYSELYITTFPVSTCIPRPFTTRNHFVLWPIVKDLMAMESYPWRGWEHLIDSLPTDSSADICLCVITERPTTSPLLVPFPPKLKRPGYPVYRTHIHDIDNDSLLQIFSHCRRQHEETWNLRVAWRNLAQVCRRWRYFMFDLSSHLDMCLSLTKYSPPMDKLSHLPPIPLIIDYSDGTKTMTSQDADNICLGLERHDRVRRVDIQAPSSSFHPWLSQMDQPFPRLVDLSLLSTTPETDEMSLVLPGTLQAPNLHRLSLHGISLPTRLPLLSSAIALSTLSLTHIRASCSLPPRHLVTQLKGLPNLEELSIGFAVQIPFPGSEGELLPPPISPVTLPALKRLTFRGEDAYLDNLVSQIYTPVLGRLTLTLHFDLTFTLVYLTEFIHRTEGLRLLVAQVIFNEDRVSIDAGCSSERLDDGKFSLLVNFNCEPVDWQIDSATQVCSALGNVLSTVEDLTVDRRVFSMASDWSSTLEDVMWHELLLPFVGVKKLHIGTSLTLELSQALKSGGGGLVLPELEELEVSLKIDEVTNALTTFIETRESVGRHIRLLVPPEDEEEKIRLQNTLAMRRSQRQELEYHWQRKVDAECKEKEIWKVRADTERKEKEKWKARALALEEKLKRLDVS